MLPPPQEKVIESENRRRKENEEEKQKENEKAVNEDYQRLVEKKLDIDTDWQTRSNKPHKVRDCSAEVVQLVDLGIVAMQKTDHQLALQYFIQAVAKPTGCSKEILDNCAIACLLAMDNHRCLQCASKLIAEHPKFVFGYLHRARAHRCLLQFEAAKTDLQTALELGTPYSPDICREIQCVNMEQKSREQRPDSPCNYIQVLGVSEDMDKEGWKEEVARTYKALAMKWHPDKWVNNPDASKCHHAATMFQRMNEANSVLCDDDRRQEWFEEFKSFERIRRPPHARFFQAKPGASGRSRSTYGFGDGMFEEAMNNEQQRAHLARQHSILRQVLQCSCPPHAIPILMLTHRPIKFPLLLLCLC